MRTKIRSVVLALSVPLVGMSLTWAGVEETKLLPSDGEQLANFGFAVALDGETAAIGAPTDLNENGKTGAVYIFGRTGDSWSEQDKLIPGDGAPLDLFGHSVALDGDTLVVGVPNDDDNGLQSGSAYVFTRVGGVWTQQAKLQPVDGVAGDEFGRRVAVDEDNLVVSSNLLNTGDIGRVYTFKRTGGVWFQSGTLVPFDGESFDVFGGSVAIEGQTLAIGAWGDDDNGLQSGSVYIYTGGTNWNFQTKLQPSDADAGTRFGNALDLDGDLLVVGSERDNENGNWAGSAYVFRRVGIGWNEEAKLLPFDGASSDVFGASVAVHGSSVVVGARSDGNTGAAYVFGLVQGEWIERFKLLPADLPPGAVFGDAVALFGESAIVGAWGDNVNGDASGSAYAFDLPPLPPDDVPAVGGVGAALLLLTILGSSAWLIRRS